MEIIVYKFKITSKHDDSILGTGNFKVCKQMTEQQQLVFLHHYTNGCYLRNQFVNIEITVV